MKHTFEAKIYKIGVNWCVDVPAGITSLMTADRGRIKVTGQINGFGFTTTLMPVRNALHRLFVNRIMMVGGKTAVDETAVFEIEQVTEKIVIDYPMPRILMDQLLKHKLTAEFESLTMYRKRSILKYLNYVKTEATMLKNIEKLINQLKNKEKDVRIP